jgi:hypothetical protein
MHRSARSARAGSRISSLERIKGSAFALRELRIQSQGRPLRVFYAFDPARQAVVLIGGDKTGDGRFYERMVPVAERIWKEYLDETAQMG